MKAPRKTKTSRFWTGKLKTSADDKVHIFDGNSDYPTLARCGTANFHNCHDRFDTDCTEAVEFMTHYGPETTCLRCRMCLCFEIWRERSKK